MSSTDLGKGSNKRPLLILIGALVLGLVMIGLGGLAVIKFIDGQRASTYNSVQDDVDETLKKTQELKADASRAAVLYSLQTIEAARLHEDLEELAKFSTDYFSKGTRSKLEAAANSLGEALTGTGLSDEEAEMVFAEVQRAKADTQEDSTAFLNLSTKEPKHFVPDAKADRVKRLPKSKVTKEAIEAARKDLADKKKDANIAQTEKEIADARAESLIVAIEGTLPALKAAAKEAPKKAKRTLKEYPRTKKDVANYLRDSADAANRSVTAEKFIVEANEIPIPLEAGAKDGEIQTATDAWRAAIIARHLREYAKSITAAWLLDRTKSQGAAALDPTRIFIGMSGF